MKHYLLVICILMTGALNFQNLAYANPYVFEFTESYDSNTNPTIFGTAIAVSVTVDNGGFSTISQNFTWNDIVGVSAKAVGGTFSDVWTNIFRATDNKIFLTTDTSGFSGTLSMGLADRESAPPISTTSRMKV